MTTRLRKRTTWQPLISEQLPSSFSTLYSGSSFHFKASFYLTFYRAISLGLIGAFFPLYPWSWYTIMVIFLLVNFVVSFKMFRLPLPNSLLTSFTAVLTPSLYPSDTPVHIAFIANFHIVNSVTTTGLIAVWALVQFLTADLHYEWNRVMSRV